MARTLLENANYINETIKPAIKSAIIAQGVSVSDSDSFLSYATKISQIGGGGGAYDLYDYIQSDGTQYINTGRKLSSGDVIRCLYMPQSGNSNWNYVWASYDNSTVKGGLVFVSNSIKSQYINGSETNRESYADGTYYEDTLTMTADSNGDTYVFSYSADTACCSYMRLYAFSINGDNYLPCKRRSDGKFGLYDVANSQFLTDSASGNAFVGGNSLGIRIG